MVVIVLASVGSIVLGNFVYGYALKEYENVKELRKSGVETTARVTAQRIEHRKKRRREGARLTSHMVKYAFEVPGSSETYHRRDSAGRGNLWSRVKPDVYERAQKVGVIKVLYLPDEPWVNIPKGVALGGFGGDQIASLVFAVALVLLGLYGFGHVAKRTLLKHGGG